MADLAKLALGLSRQLAPLRSRLGATHVYDPSDYARAPMGEYLRRYCAGEKRILFMGMNPGPWGMAQTGVPFGAVPWVRDWMGISGKVGAPPDAHPQRPVLGWKCPRVEVSGDRLWSFFGHAHGSAADFFSSRCVVNYCPLLFLSANDGGVRNIAVNKMTGNAAGKMFALCDEHMDAVLRATRPEIAIGIGDWAERRLLRLAGLGSLQVGKILHPSPASPLANRGFAKVAAEQLRVLGVHDLALAS